MASVPDMVKKQPTRIAVLFPGQGSQVVGMLSELAETYPEIHDTFTEASTALGEDLWAICQDEDKLNKTQYTQPALLTASIAVWRILQQKIEDKPCYLAGHSLGEYSALCAAGVISLADAVKLVHKRGQLMQEAVAGVDTAMAAVLGLEDHRVENLCEQATEHVDDAIVGAANFNSPGQVVVSGNAAGVNAVIDKVQNTGKKAIPLKVSVPSHCALMEPATNALADELAAIQFDQATIPVIQNRHARVESNAVAIKQALTEQLSEPVLWSKTMQELADKQINILIECGSGNVLSNLAKRQAHPIVSYPTDKPARLDKLMEVLS
ncbi:MULTISPECIES: ACP S-malonyltransferase [Psychrobacter]|uniref:Malonyl CoA-acyl carrier protein transacylase n=1 Tax=Psychrobacter faecalis TaxID=180588 RepID=A0ABT9HDL7_9GAMM|nr:MULTISPECIES: ACP S-malonyltransferase [Psychrobacter]MDP4543859.1 ACP S-malonyltransferase [Psychrobacter faecalis]OAP66951.1 malonyl CoA-acyl carrier protein transacylase [Psychrobacter sp. SHUES1]PKG83401.1 [acyl-carrier-protein] S-malonyltransferase [Psychrobacter sp. Sarcosine-02u-2]HCR87322.1 [acyl-carrier-protein] S-malonyltransferase [Psychrobacter sp.]